MRQFEDAKPHRRADDRSSHDCAYEANGLRCKFAGSIGHSVVGGGPYFCRIHIRERGNAIAWQALERSQSWSVPSAPEFNPRTDPYLMQHLPMLDGETMRDYAGRCKALVLAKGLRVKPVVGFAPPERQREPGEDGVA